MSEEKPIFLFSATFRIKNAGTFHEEITRTTGIEPTDSHIRGEAKSPKSEHLETWQNDMWTLESPLSEDEDLSAHLSWFWDELSPHREYFEQLVEKGVQTDISCVYRSDSETAGFAIQPHALAVACELNIPLEISVRIYDIPDELYDEPDD